MTLLLGCIADDYTGASDLASMLSRSGLRTVQTIGVPDDALELPEIDAVVVALKTRSIAAQQAVAASLEAARWLRARGAGHLLFKICSTFDSTDLGNIGPVLDALRAETGAAMVPVNPAFIETGRTVYMGHLFVGGVPLHESALKDHPLTPMRDSDLVRVLARQSASPVGLVPLPVVEQGPLAIRERLAGLSEAGSPAAIVDAVSLRHLESLGEAALSGPLSVGASGIGYGLARALLALHGVRQAAAPAPGTGAVPPPGTGHAVILAGSCSAATLRQIDYVSDRIACWRLDAAALMEGDAELARARAWAREHLPRGPILISSSAPPETVRALQQHHGAAAAGHAIEQALASLAEDLVGQGADRLVVAGGETSGAVVDRLGLRAFAVGREIAPGVPVLQALGQGPRLALKSGNFGADSFFADALAALR